MCLQSVEGIRLESVEGISLQSSLKPDIENKIAL